MTTIWEHIRKPYIFNHLIQLSLLSHLIQLVYIINDTYLIAWSEKVKNAKCIYGGI